MLKSLDTGVSIQRKRSCACGARWTTNETIIRGSLVVNRGPLVAISGQKTTVPGQETSSPGKGAYSFSDPIPESDPDQIRDNPPNSRKRGPAKTYSPAFEACWKQYGRKEEKLSAYQAWKIEVRQFGGEENLRDLILAALKWQAPIWAKDGWKFAKYFERYLRKHKWQDERPGQVQRAPERPTPSPPPLKPVTPWTEEQKREARELRGFVNGLAESKGVE